MFTQLLSRRAPASLADIAPLGLRIALGAIFIMYGYAKSTGFGVAGVSKTLGGIGFPAPELFAYILMYEEVVTGIAIILGALTYCTTLFQLVVSVIAGVFIHLPKGFSADDGGYEFVLLIGAVALSLFITGPGKYSVDTRLARKGSVAPETST